VRANEDRWQQITIFEGWSCQVFVSRLCDLEHADWQRQSDYSTASGPIRDPSDPAMSLDDRIHKCKSETVPRRMFSLNEAVKSTAPDLRREPRTIVFDHQFR
jgi:hypothetical protein